MNKLNKWYDNLEEPKRFLVFLMIVLVGFVIINFGVVFDFPRLIIIGMFYLTGLIFIRLDNHRI